MRNIITFRRAILLVLLAVAAVVLLPARPAAAADCYLDQSSKVYVCDARPVQPTFTTSGYQPGSVFFTRTYAWMDDYANFYTAPHDGAPVADQASEGILYYTIEEITTDGAGATWYRVGRDLWARAENMHVVDDSTFAGVQVHSQPARPFGWVLVNFRPAPAPDVEPAEDVDYVRRYTFIEIYDVAEGEEGWSWFDIGGGRWVKQTYVSLVDVGERPDDVGPRDFWVEVDLYEQVFAAYEGDRMVYAGLVSSGLDRWPTNEGLFKIYAAHKEWNMYGGDVGDDYYFLEDVPHTMFFDKDIALHGAYWHNEFGQQRSHGCVNMPPRDAEWIYYWTEDAPGDVWVNVLASPPDHFLQQYGTNFSQAGAITLTSLAR